MHSRCSPGCPGPPPSMPPAIEVADLVKTYGPLRAVDGVSFQVETGHIFGLLGPNGAGKSTTVEMVEGLRPADGGKIEVLGIDVRHEPRRVKERIGVQLQTTAFFKQLSAAAAPGSLRQLFSTALPVEQLIAAVNLEEKADDAERESFRRPTAAAGHRDRAGQRPGRRVPRRTHHRPRPAGAAFARGRSSLRLQRRGQDDPAHHALPRRSRTALRRLVVIDHGKVIAEGTPAGLIAEHFERSSAGVLERRPRCRPAALERLPGVDHLEEATGRRGCALPTSRASTVALVELCAQRGVELRGLSVHTATLEDVFLKLTGRRIRE